MASDEEVPIQAEKQKLNSCTWILSLFSVLVTFEKSLVLLCWPKVTPAQDCQRGYAEADASACSSASPLSSRALLWRMKPRQVTLLSGGYGAHARDDLCP